MTDDFEGVFPILATPLTRGETSIWNHWNELSGSW